jgi:tetratricopeptide (TPR) repeat protein
MELEPAVQRFARQCGPVNQNALNNPKVHLLLGDARELLLTTKQTYDLIASEPSNPYRAGLANLFTREYYQSAASKLRPGGLFLQWLQTYDVDVRTVEIFYRTFHSVFPQVETWYTRTGDLLVIGSMQPIAYDVPALRERIKQPPFKDALANVWRTDDLEGIFGRYVANSDFPMAFLLDRPVLLNTDDRPLLEFAFARNTSSTVNNYSLTRLHREAVRTHTDRPALLQGELDWPKVEAHRATMFLAYDPEFEQPAFVAREQRDLVAVSRAHAAGDLPATLEAWRKLGREPQNLVELTIAAECLAEAGDAAAVPLIERLRTLDLPEAEALAARLLWRQKDEERAAKMLQAAFSRFRSNPWPIEAILNRTFALACEMAADLESNKLVEQIYLSIEQPLAVYQSDSVREETRLELGVLLDGGTPGPHMLAGLEAVEPHIPWELTFLELREQCYTALGHPKARAAKRDVEAFITAEGGSVRRDEDLPQPPIQRRLADLADEEKHP